MSASSDNTLGASWKASAGHGTPGRRNSVSTGTLESSGPALPATTGLEQNYPNPFNGTTQISFRIASAGYATLKVYDVLGREVADLYEGRCQPGVYAAAFNASDLASGVYLCRLTVDGFSETRRLVLMNVSFFERGSAAPAMVGAAQTGRSGTVTRALLMIACIAVCDRVRSFRGLLRDALGVTVE